MIQTQETQVSDDFRRGIDVLACPEREGRCRVIACIQDTLI